MKSWLKSLERTNIDVYLQPAKGINSPRYFISIKENNSGLVLFSFNEHKDKLFTEATIQSISFSNFSRRLLFASWVSSTMFLCEFSIFYWFDNYNFFSRKLLVNADISRKITFSCRVHNSTLNMTRCNFAWRLKLRNRVLIALN